MITCASHFQRRYRDFGESSRDQTFSGRIRDVRGTKEHRWDRAPFTRLTALVCGDGWSHHTYHQQWNVRADLRRRTIRHSVQLSAARRAILHRVQFRVLTTEISTDEAESLQTKMASYSVSPVYALIIRSTVFHLIEFLSWIYQMDCCRVSCANSNCIAVLYFNMCERELKHSKRWNVVGFIFFTITEALEGMYVLNNSAQSTVRVTTAKSSQQQRPLPHVIRLNQTALSLVTIVT